MAVPCVYTSNIRFAEPGPVQAALGVLAMSNTLSGHECVLGHKGVLKPAFIINVIISYSYFVTALGHLCSNPLSCQKLWLGVVDQRIPWSTLCQRCSKWLDPQDALRHML